VSSEDALGLFAGPIVQIDMAFRGHIEDRSKEMGVPSGMYEHALFLCDLVRSKRN
jgi:hypothetical protein